MVIRRSFVGDNNNSDSASDMVTYPVFQVGSNCLDCTPDSPPNGGQFLCSTSLPSKITNRILSMFVDPNAAIQRFHNDYIRHGFSSQAAQAANGTAVHVQPPDVTTTGLTFEGDWQYQTIGGVNDIESAMQTLMSSSKATYSFFGRFLILQLILLLKINL